MYGTQFAYALQIPLSSIHACCFPEHSLLNSYSPQLILMVILKKGLYMIFSFEDIHPVVVVVVLSFQLMRFRIA